MYMLKAVVPIFGKCWPIRSIGLPSVQLGSALGLGYTLHPVILAVKVASIPVAYIKLIIISTIT